MDFSEIDESASPLATRPRGGVRAGAGHPIGTTKLQLDCETLARIEAGRIMCTVEELAATMLVARQTMIDFLDKHKSARDAYEGGKALGKASLRQLQYEAAQKGNVTAQIWLGKQWLNQKDSARHSEGTRNARTRTQRRSHP